MTIDPIDLYNLRKLVDTGQLAKLRRYAKNVLAMRQEREHVDHREGSIASSLPMFGAVRGGISYFTGTEPAPTPGRDQAILAFQRKVNDVIRSNGLSEITDDQLEELGLVPDQIPPRDPSAGLPTGIITSGGWTAPV